MNKLTTRLLKGLVHQPFDYVISYSQLSELINPPSLVHDRKSSNNKVPIMTRMFLDTPLVWDTITEMPQQDGSLCLEVNSSEAKQGHGTHIPHGEGPTVSKSKLPLVLA